LVNWDIVCKSKREGGLRVINLCNMNLALLGKWLWRFKNSNESSIWKEIVSNRYYNGWYNLHQPAVRFSNNLSFFWKSILRCSDAFKLGIHSIMHSGNSTSFYHDSWISVIPLKVEFKNLFDICNFQDALIMDVYSPSTSPPWDFSFNDSLVGSSLRQLVLLYARLSHYNIDLEPDILDWSWDRSNKFISNSFYGFLNFSGVTDNTFRHI